MIDTIARMQQTRDLQQAQLRLLYQRVQQDKSGSAEAGYSPGDEVPPHY